MGEHTVVPLVITTVTLRMYDRSSRAAWMELWLPIAVADTSMGRVLFNRKPIWKVPLMARQKMDCTSSVTSYTFGSFPAGGMGACTSSPYALIDTWMGEGGGGGGGVMRRRG